MNAAIDEQVFLRLADTQLERIEAALERAIEADELDIDVELKAGGVMLSLIHISEPTRPY